MADGHHVLTFGGWILDGPRLVLDLQPGAAAELLAAVREVVGWNHPARSNGRTSPASLLVGFTCVRACAGSLFLLRKVTCGIDVDGLGGSPVRDRFPDGVVHR